MKCTNQIPERRRATLRHRTLQSVSENSKVLTESHCNASCLLGHQFIFSVPPLLSLLKGPISVNLMAPYKGGVPLVPYRNGLPYEVDDPPSAPKRGGSHKSLFSDIIRFCRANTLGAAERREKEKKTSIGNITLRFIVLPVHQNWASRSKVQNVPSSSTNLVSPTNNWRTRNPSPMHDGYKYLSRYLCADAPRPGLWHCDKVARGLIPKAGDGRYI